MNVSAFLGISEKVIHAYNRMCEPLLEEFALPQVSFDILMFLANNPDFSTAQEICTVRHIKKNLVSVHVEKLVQAGLLERQEVAGDRRKIALRCTEKATPVINAGKQRQNQFYQQLTAGITAAQWQVFGDIQATVEHNAEQMARPE